MYSDSENNQSETGKKLVAIDPDVVNELRATAPSDELITFVETEYHADYVYRNLPDHPYP